MTGVRRPELEGRSAALVSFKKGCEMDTGVYLIFNSISGKKYIGSTAKSFKHRWAGHRKELIGGYHGNKHLQHAWDKYGPNAFEFEIVERCLPEQCLAREQWWLDSFDRKDLYNHYLTAGSPLGSTHTDETKAVMSAKKIGNKNANGRKSWKPESHESHRRKISERKHGEEEKVRRAASMRRFYQSEAGIAERKRKAIETAANWTGKKHTEESKLKMSESAKRSRSPEHRKAISDAAKKRWADPEYRERKRLQMLGTSYAAGKRSEAAKENMRAAARKKREQQ